MKQLCDHTDEERAQHNAEATGDCFEAAGNAFIDANYHDRGEGWILCHGNVTIQRGEFAGERTGHAWLELPERGLCLDLTNGRKLDLPQRLYYALGKINADDVQRYDWERARAALIGQGHYGPWHNLGE